LSRIFKQDFNTASHPRNPTNREANAYQFHSSGIARPVFAGLFMS
jgi:hypothetical protein